MPITGAHPSLQRRPKVAEQVAATADLALAERMTLVRVVGHFGADLLGRKRGKTVLVRAQFWGEGLVRLVRYPPPVRRTKTSHRAERTTTVAGWRRATIGDLQSASGGLSARASVRATERPKLTSVNDTRPRSRSLIVLQTGPSAGWSYQLLNHALRVINRTDRRGTPRNAAEVKLGKDGKDALRVTTTLPRALKVELDNLADRQGVKTAWIVRRAVEQYLDDARGGPLLPLELENGRA